MHTCQGDPHPARRCPQEVREAFLAQDALKAVVTLVAEPLSNHPEMSERVQSTAMPSKETYPHGIDPANGCKYPPPSTLSVMSEACSTRRVTS